MSQVKHSMKTTKTLATHRWRRQSMNATINYRLMPLESRMSVTRSHISRLQPMIDRFSRRSAADTFARRVGSYRTLNLGKSSRIRSCHSHNSFTSLKTFIPFAWLPKGPTGSMGAELNSPRKRSLVSGLRGRQLPSGRQLRFSSDWT